VITTRSTSGSAASRSASVNQCAAPNRAAASRALAARLVPTAVSSYCGSDRSAGMWAVAAQPRSGLAPMMPTRILSLILRAPLA
jgi:hypothetical protein